MAESLPNSPRAGRQRLLGNMSGRNMSIDEIYRITRGTSGNWGISEYRVPKNNGPYRSISYGVSKEKGMSFFD
jgi:hypothetical protein